MQPGFCKNAGSAAGNDLICQNLDNDDRDGSKGCCLYQHISKVHVHCHLVAQASTKLYSMKVKTQL